jgi:hypothetical protein
MKSPRWILILSALLISAPLPASAQAWAHGSMFLDSRGLQHLHVSVGQVYGISTYQVRQYHPGWLHPEEVPVLHLIAREARVSPQVVLALREAGWSWWDISLHLRVRPRTFTAHLPYQPWVGSGYSDWQIVEWVNVGFWARAYHRPVREVIIIRERVPTWTHVIHHYTPTVVVYTQAPTPPRANPVVQGRAAPAPQAAPPPRPAVPRTAPSTATAPAAAQGARVAPQSQPQPRGGNPVSAPAAAPVPRAPTPAAARSAVTPPVPAAARSQGQTSVPSMRTPPAAAQAPAQAPSPSPRAAPAPATRTAPPPPAPAARGGGAERRPAVRPPSGSER